MIRRDQGPPTVLTSRRQVRFSKQVHRPVQRREVHYSGRVQGVGFRYETHKMAHGSPVTGYVENLEDGRVRIVVEGASSDIDAFLAGIADRMSGRIKDVREEIQLASGEFSDFQVRR